MTSMKEIEKRIKIERDFIKASGKNWLSPEEQEELKELMGGELTNEMRSAHEVHTFNTDRPEKYTVYVDFREEVATTWTGEVLGDITWRGPEYTDNFGGSRINFDVKMKNGDLYYGTAFVSAGDYASIKKKKKQPLSKKKGKMPKDLV